ncbi:sugar transferase [Enterococcus faecium]|nr:sugar transferase [Enterococcus faecium]EME7096854.1 sugar transferase [Enterococcus faecium]NTR92134.1 sugar transferase [Enterococcus faecium]
MDNKVNFDSIDMKYRENSNSLKKYFFLKRGIDIIGSLIGLILLMPIFIGVAAILKIEEFEGDIFFSQVRIGKNGEKFIMYKFRSMYMNAEEQLEELLKLNDISGAMFKMKEDPRITRVGKFIRRTSIDELPQLWNVLKGNMSLVGPRPAIPREVKVYTPYDRQRLIVKPGCTGLWQISGRNNLSFNEMVRLDLEYIQHPSIARDINIIFKTIILMVKPNGAY